MKIKKIGIITTIIAVVILVSGYFTLRMIKANYDKAKTGPQHSSRFFSLIEKPVSDLSVEKSKEFFELMELKIPDTEDSVYIKTIGIILSPTKEHKEVYVELDGIKNRDSFVDFNTSQVHPAIFFSSSWNSHYIDGSYRYYLAFVICHTSPTDEDYLNSIFSAYEKLKSASDNN